MGWPFSSAAAPSFDSGFTTVPAAPTNPPNADSVSTFWLMGGSFANEGDDDAYVLLTDGSDKAVLPDLLIPAHDILRPPPEWPFMPIVGLKWSCTKQTVTGKLWGYV
jgi:hypothetical protein